MCLYASMHMKEGMWAGTCVQHVHASALIKARNSCTFALANGCMLFRMCIRKCTHSRSCTSSFFCVFVCIERERERESVGVESQHLAERLVHAHIHALIKESHACVIEALHPKNMDCALQLSVRY